MSKPSEDEQDEVLLSCRYGDLEDVQQFVEKYGAQSLSEIRDWNGNTVIHMSCGNGHLDILDYVLPLISPELLAVKNNSGSTALHWAALNAHLPCIQKLVQFPAGPGVNLIDIKNEVGLSPLAEAERAGWDEGAKWFVGVMNLETEQGVKEDEADAAVDEKDIEVEIEDADGQVAKLSISGAER